MGHRHILPFEMKSWGGGTCPPLATCYWYTCWWSYCQYSLIITRIVTSLFTSCSSAIHTRTWMHGSCWSLAFHGSSSRPSCVPSRWVFLSDNSRRDESRRHRRCGQSATKINSNFGCNRESKPDSHQVLMSSYRTEIQQFPNTVMFLMIPSNE